MTLKEKLQNYKAPVSDAEWQAIANAPAVVHFNRTKRLVRTALYTASSALVVAAAVAVVVALGHPKAEVRNVDSQAVKTQTAKVGSLTQNVETNVAGENPVIPVTETVATTSEPTTEKINTPASEPAVTMPMSNQGQRVVPATIAMPSVSHSAPVATATKPVKQELATSTPKSVTTPKEEIVNEETPIEQPTEPTFEEQFFVPNSFTPNGDGINDLFMAKANFEPSTFEMSIFSRTGDMVFKSRNMNIGWDGDKHPGGMYNYMIRYTNTQGKVLVKKGQVMMLK